MVEVQSIQTHGSLVRREQPEKAAGGIGRQAGQAASTSGEALPVCPCCERVLEDGPPFIVDRNTFSVSANGHIARLTQAQFDLIERLHKAKGQLVTFEQLLFCLYGAHGREEAETSDNVLKSLISKLRTNLEPLGWVIENRVGCGYRLMQGQRVRGAHRGRPVTPKGAVACA